MSATSEQLDLTPSSAFPAGGQVVAVASSPTHGFSKQSQPVIQLVAGEGVEGDAHRGHTVQHLYLKRRTPQMPNHSQLHLFAAEMLEELAAKGFPLKAGDLGENVLTRGLDLLALPTGTRLHLGPAAIVRLTGLRTPCAKLDTLRAGLQQHLWGKRDAAGKRTRRAGVMSVIEVGGELHPGDPIRVVLPPEPHQPLQPV